MDEWALESGLPRTVVDSWRSRRLAVASTSDDQADAAAARELCVDEDDDYLDDANPTPRALLMPAAARVSAPEEGVCPPPGDLAALMAWVGQQRENQTGWADLRQLTTAAGHTLSEEALRTRFRRWRDQHGGEPSPSDE